MDDSSHRSYASPIPLLDLLHALLLWLSLVGLNVAVLSTVFESSALLKTIFIRLWVSAVVLGLHGLLVLGLDYLIPAAEDWRKAFRSVRLFLFSLPVGACIFWSWPTNYPEEQGYKILFLILGAVPELIAITLLVVETAYLARLGARRRLAGGSQLRLDLARSLTIGWYKRPLAICLAAWIVCAVLFWGAGIILPQAGWRVIPVQGVGNDRITAASADSLGRVWAATIFDLHHWDGKSWHQVQHRRMGTTVDIAVDYSNHFWLAFDGIGVFMFYANGERVIEGCYPFSNQTVLLDQYRQAWVRCETNTLCEVSSGPPVEKKIDVTGRIPFGFDGQGRLWAYTWMLNTPISFTLYDGANWKDYQPAGMFSTNPIAAVDHQGHPWAARLDNCCFLIRFDGDRFIQVPIPLEISSESYITDLVFDPQDRLWLSISNNTGSDDLVVTDGRIWRLYKIDNHSYLLPGPPNRLSIDPGGNLWLGHGRTLYSTSTAQLPSGNPSPAWLAQLRQLSAVGLWLIPLVYLILAARNYSLRREQNPAAPAAKGV